MTASLKTDDYLSAVAGALADLDPADRDDLLEDLQLHLAELRVEDPSVDLVARLGTPAAYAEELRQSAGLPAAPGGPSWADRLTSARNSLQDKASRRPWMREVLQFVPQLRPAWWVLRAYGVFALGDWVLHSGGYRWGIDVVPQVRGSHIVGLVGLTLLVVTSVRLATRPPAMRAWPRIALAANAVLAIATPAYFVTMNQTTGYVDPGYSGPCCGLLYGDNGRVISNLYGYDSQGNLVPQVQLFDQDGVPVSVSVDTVNGVPSESNVYPHPQYLEDGTFGVPTPPAFGGPQLVAPTPQATPVP